jgi:uncharacterized membrane protein
MPKKKNLRKLSKCCDFDSKTSAFFTTFFSIIGFIFYLVCWKKDKYVTFYAKQSLVIFIIGIILAAIAGLFNALFFYMPFIGKIISAVLNIFWLILWLQSWIYALSGKMKDVTMIDEYTRKIDF